MQYNLTCTSAASLSAPLYYIYLVWVLFTLVTPWHGLSGKGAVVGNHGAAHAWLACDVEQALAGLALDCHGHGLVLRTHDSKANARQS